MTIKKKLNKKQALTKTKVTKRKPGRPKSKKSIEQIDLLALKQSILLDDVEGKVREKHAKEMEADGTKEIVVPYTPSKHQKEVHELISQYRFGVVVVHRGWGKTWLAANELIRRAWTCPAPQGGKFIYVAPEKLQAKKIVWKEIKFFVQDLPHTVNEAELTITFPNGSSVELAGADNPDRLRGQHPHFVVLDEVAQMPRDTWYEAVYPSLRANKGGALFIGTPKGDNLFRELYDLAGENEKWFNYRKTIYDTTVATKEEIEDLISTMPGPKFEQEYLCSFEAAIQGTFFGPIIDDPKKNLVGIVPFDPSQPVITSWDLGTTDSTAIWFVQRDNKDSKLLRVIDFYENKEQDVFHYISEIKKRPYIYDHHIMPHDVTHVSWETKRTRLDIFKQHGMKVVVAKKAPISEGIAMAQAMLYTCRFDADKCYSGLSHLRQYRAKQNKLTGEFLEDPVHDMHSHAADAFRTLAVGLKNLPSQDYSKVGYAESSYDYFSPSTSGRSPYDNQAAQNSYDIFDPTNGFK